jgi:phospho-N-acetylmuramoyl-pentapeptide-transferase
MLTINFVIPFAAALVVTLVITWVLIPFFHKKQFGQYIREEGPKAHLKKQGTPTMGGLAIVIGIAVGVLATGVTADKVVILLTMLAFGAIGFLDDFEKIAKKNNLGLTAKQKIVLQVLFSIGIGIYMIKSAGGGTDIYIPFLKDTVDFGWLFIPFVIFTEVAMSNGVNLTDGLDGLASSVTAIVGILFCFVGYAMRIDVMLISGLALTGSLIGFLVFNKYPAKIFMGDTGSMALGGFLSAVGIVTKCELLLPIAGIIYVAEALSVIIQVTYFKKTGGKRFFRMAPIHHHFELGGMKEYNVVLMFSAITAVFCVIAYFSAV